jgi:hypothetical protein
VFRGLTWIDWVSAGGAILSVIGVAVALWQLRKTARAATAAKEATERTERRLALNQILIIVPQLLTIEQDLEAAANDGDVKAVIRYLYRWRGMANELRGLLGDEVAGDYRDLRSLLQKSSALASRAKSNLFRDPKSPLEVTRQVRTIISDVCDQCGTFAGQLRAYSREVIGEPRAK